MNSFGRLFRVSIFGESHGEVVGVLVDGCPHGLSLQPSDFTDDIKKRRPSGEGATARKEADVPLIKSGLFNGKTTGAPLLIEFENSDSISKDYDFVCAVPRPGHADFVAAKKFGGNHDYRGGGHFSGRLTLGIVAAGVIAKKMTGSLHISSKIVEVGGQSDWEELLKQTIKEKDSVGGIVETTVSGLSVGLGEPFFNSLESLISHAIFSIPGIKGIEFGAGLSATRMKGSEMNDLMVASDGTTATNNAGGVNGGITNGNNIVFRVAVKPPSSISKRQRTVNIETEEMSEIEIIGRHDAAFVLRTPVIIEAMTAIVLADFLLQQTIGS